MRILLPVLGLIITSAFNLQAEWTTDYKAALTQARTQNKLVLLNFTGSDWCPSCKLLDRQVFTQASFKDLADKTYILVTVDFPQKAPLSPDLQKQNNDLGDQFKIEGFPTLVVVDSSGKELGRQLGYDPHGGPDPIVSTLKSFAKSGTGHPVAASQ
jgi:thioredoxin-related protein